MPLTLLYLGFFTSGFLATADLPVVGKKLAIPDFFLTLLVAFTLLAGIRKSPPLRVDNSILPFVLAGAAFVYHSTISMLVNGILDGAGALAGAITVANYWYGFAMFICAIVLLDSWDKVMKALIAWLAGGAVVALFGVWGVAGGAPAWVYDGLRISSTLKGVNQMQSYLAPALYAFLLFLFFGNLRFGTKLIVAISVAMSSISLLATGSRASIAIMLACFAFVALLLFRRARRSPGMLLVALCSAGGLLAAVVPYVVLVWNRGVEIFPEGPLRGLARPIVKFRQMTEVVNAVEALGPRAEQFRIVLTHWHERPILGVGPGNFPFAFDHHREVHNSYLGILVEHGVLGLILYTVFTAGILAVATIAASKSRESSGKFMLSVLAGSTALLLLYGMSSFGVRQRIFWLTLGLTTAAIQLYYRDRRSTAAVSPGGAPAGARQVSLPEWSGGSANPAGDLS